MILILLILVIWSKKPDYDTNISKIEKKFLIMIMLNTLLLNQEFNKSKSEILFQD